MIAHVWSMGGRLKRADVWIESRRQWTESGEKDKITGNHIALEYKEAAAM